MESRYWRAAEPKPSYEVVIVGGGGHGLATAYYLAKNHGITDVCVVEKGWLARRQHGAQHDDHPLELPLGRVHGDLRALAEALGGARGGARRRPRSSRQRGVLNLAHDLGDVRGRDAARARQPAERRRRRVARARARSKAFCPIAQRLARRCAIRSLGATHQRRGGVGSARQGGVGVRDRRRAARRRHRRARRGDRVPPRARAVAWRASTTTRGTIRACDGRARGRGSHERARRRWSGCGSRSSRTRCRRWCRRCSSRCSTAS